MSVQNFAAYSAAFSHFLPKQPTLTSFEADCRNIKLTHYRQPPIELPEISVAEQV